MVGGGGLRLRFVIVLSLVFYGFFFREIRVIGLRGWLLIFEGRWFWLKFIACDFVKRWGRGVDVYFVLFGFGGFTRVLF